MEPPASRSRESASDEDAARAGGDVPHTGVHRMVRRFLEPVQDTLVVLLAVALLGLMVRALISLGARLFAPGMSFRQAVGEILYVLVLTELQRLLIVYLREHHVSVDVAIETSIVAALREVIVLGAAEMEPLRLAVVTVFVVALGLLLRFGDLRCGRRRAHAQDDGRLDFPSR